MAVDNNEEKNKIVLNRKMRLWNKYKKPVIGVILAVVVIAVVAIVLKLCSIGKPVEDKATTLANNNNNNKQGGQNNKGAQQQGKKSNGLHKHCLLQT